MSYCPYFSQTRTTWIINKDFSRGRSINLIQNPASILHMAPLSFILTIARAAVEAWITTWHDCLRALDAKVRNRLQRRKGSSTTPATHEPLSRFCKQPSTLRTSPRNQKETKKSSCHIGTLHVPNSKRWLNLEHEPLERPLQDEWKLKPDIHFHAKGRKRVDTNETGFQVSTYLKPTCGPTCNHLLALT